jgi:hypothetical protein
LTETDVEYVEAALSAVVVVEVGEPLTIPGKSLIVLLNIFVCCTFAQVEDV